VYVVSAYSFDVVVKMLELVNCEYINRFVGVCIDPAYSSVLMLYAPRGSLDDIISSHSGSSNVTSAGFLIAMLSDIAAVSSHN